MSRLIIILLNVIMLSVVMLSVVMLNVVKLNVVMLSVVMLKVIMLNVAAPKRRFSVADNYPQPFKKLHFSDFQKNLSFTTI